MDKKIESLRKILEKVFSYLEIDPDFTIEDNPDKDSLAVKIWNEELSFLIGYRGNCLKALRYFLGLALNKGLEEEGWTRVTVDIDGYVERRQEKIEEITRNYIDKVRFFGQEIHMPNMDSSERFMVHTYVGDYPDIVSESEGEGFARHVVLKPAKQKDPDK